ncbi:HAD family hydrolase [Candidatus Micrarchaeota archaeon]|nr:HAD family hydrolase [Candidatus Micrarchaeota archaeon]
MASRARKKLIVFDFDGVIIDSFAEHKRRYDYVYRTFGRRNPAKTLKEWKKWHDSAWELNFTRVGIEGKQINVALERYWNGFAYAKSKPFKGIELVLRAISRKYALAIISNTKGSAVSKALSKFNLRKFFAVIQGGSHESGKAVRLAAVLEKCKARAADAVIIGDTPADIRAGKALGVKTLAVSYGWSTKERINAEKPDATARTPGGIPKAVEKLFSAKRS